jgi:hypothetical protein
VGVFSSEKHIHGVGKRTNIRIFPVVRLGLGRTNRALGGLSFRSRTSENLTDWSRGCNFLLGLTSCAHPPDFKAWFQLFSDNFSDGLSLSCLSHLRDGAEGSSRSPLKNLKLAPSNLPKFLVLTRGILTASSQMPICLEKNMKQSSLVGTALPPGFYRGSSIQNVTPYSGENLKPVSFKYKGN